MKKHILEFIRRGFMVCGFGPLVLVVLYLILQRQGLLQTVSVNQISLGIVSLTCLAFIAGGMNIIYQIERLPLMAAISIHGGVLYISYLVTYLINGWLAQGKKPFLIFTAIFLLGYVAIWAVIYCISKKNTAKVNALLKEKQKTAKSK